jgi:NADH-quinone oxidoreductase subunit C
MSAASDLPATIPAPAPGHPLAADALVALLIERIPGAVRDGADRWDATVLIPGEQLRDAVLFLRDDRRLRMEMLLDIVGVDYLSYPGHRRARFSVIYLFKSLAHGHRIKLKVEVDEDAPEVPSIHDLYKIADWHERETWDQMGVVFRGHPNLKRLLNHHEFVGHPLRKDYPCQKRQKLSVNDPMLDQLDLRLRQLGYTVLSEGAITSSPERAPAGGIDGAGDRGAIDPDLQHGTQTGGQKRGVL